MKNQFEQMPASFWRGRVVGDRFNKNRYGHIDGLDNMFGDIKIMVKWDDGEPAKAIDSDDLILL